MEKGTQNSKCPATVKDKMSDTAEARQSSYSLETGPGYLVGACVLPGRRLRK